MIDTEKMEVYKILNLIIIRHRWKVDPFRNIKPERASIKCVVKSTTNCLSTPLGHQARQTIANLYASQAFDLMTQLFAILTKN